MSLKVVKYRIAEEDLIGLSAMPSIGRLWESQNPRLQGIRIYTMPEGFRNYQIVYRRVGDVIEIMTIVQGARDLERVIGRLLFE